MAPLKIIQLNVLAWTFLRRNELYNIFRLEDPDVILLNSHGRKDIDRIKIYGYNVYQFNESNGEHDGAAIAVRKGIRHKVIDDFDESFIAIIVNTTLFDICIGTGYQPPRRPAFPIENLQRMLRRNIPLIFIGDLNAQHSVLGNASSNANGKVIKQLSDNGTARRIQTDFDTWMSSSGRGRPDIILLNQNNFLNVVTRAGAQSTSDHIPIVVNLATSPIMIPSSPWYNFGKANWDAFRQDLSDIEQIDIDKTTIIKIDEELDKWFDKVINAMDRNIPKTNYRAYKYPVLTAEISQIIDQLNILSRVRNYNYIIHRLMVDLKRTLKEKWKEQINKQWESTIMETKQEYKDPHKFWRRVKQLMGSVNKQVDYLLKDDNSKRFEPEEKEREFREKWESIYKISDEVNRQFCPIKEAEVVQFLRENELLWKNFDDVDLSRLSNDSRLLYPVILRRCVIY